MELKEKLLMSAGLHLAGMVYLLNGEGACGTFLIACAVMLCLTMAESRERTDWLWIAKESGVAAAAGLGLLSLQPVGLRSWWSVALGLSALAGVLSVWRLGQEGRRLRHRIRRRLNVLLAAGVLMGVLLAMMPSSWMPFLLQGMYAESAKALPRFLLPWLILFPEVLLQLRLTFPKIRRAGVQKTELSIK